MANIKVYYFSGTGNSWYISKELQKRIPEIELIPIAKLLNEKAIDVEVQTIGFIFPIHLSTVPLFIRDLIKKMDLKSVKYIFAIATRIGTQHSAFHIIDMALKRKKQRLSAYFNINMPSNDPKFGFKALAEKEVIDLEVKVQEQLDTVSKIILNRDTCRKKDETYISRVPLVNALAVLVFLTENMQQNFYADERCGGCGICKKVCPSGKIKMISEKPVWQKEVKCLKCYACLNFCPQQAVQIKGYTEGKDRYSHPFATVDDIVRQKNELGNN